MFLGSVDLEIPNQSILHSEKPVMAIQHWRSEIERMHSTTGTAMMMGKKWQLTHLYYTISTGEYN